MPETGRVVLPGGGRVRAVRDGQARARVLLAATAELAGLTVLHQDRDFELIAQVTGQPLERLEAV